MRITINNICIYNIYFLMINLLGIKTFLKEAW